MTPEPAELKPCPFCGSSEIKLVYLHNVRWGATCDACDCLTDDSSDTKEEAVKFWNTRTTPEKE